MSAALAAGGLAAQSPIFNHMNFERLEHEGQREFGGRLQQLRDLP